MDSNIKEAKNWIKFLRKANGFSQGNLGAALNMDQATLSRLENGEQEIKLNTALKIAEIFSVDLNSFDTFNTSHIKTDESEILLKLIKYERILANIKPSFFSKRKYPKMEIFINNWENGLYLPNSDVLNDLRNLYLLIDGPFLSKHKHEAIKNFWKEHIEANGKISIAS